MDLAVVCRNFTTVQYTEQILLHHVVPVAYGGGPEFLLMHDNARAHVAAITMDVLQRLDIQVMEWPAVSPNLNPFEPVWDMLDRHVSGCPVAPQTLQELEHALIEEWERIP